MSPYYLFAFLTSEIGVEQLKQLMTGTVINVIHKNLCKNIRCLLDEETQEDIAFKMEEELLEYYSY